MRLAVRAVLNFHPYARSEGRSEWQFDAIISFGILQLVTVISVLAAPRPQASSKSPTAYFESEDVVRVRRLAVGLLVAGVAVAGAVLGVTPAWAAAGDPILLDTGASFQTSTGRATGGLFDINPQSGTQKPISPTSTSPGTDYLNGNNPRGIAVGSDGYILVSQQNGFARDRGGVIGINPSTGEQRVVSSERSMVNPMGIAIDPSQDPANPVGSAGNVIVSDTGANAVVRLNPVTNVQALVAAAGSPLVAVRGIAVAEDGTIFVADHGRPGVEVLVPGATAFAVMVEKSPFESPEGVAVSLDQQSIYVVDPNANAVFQVQRSTGTVSTVYQGSPFNHPLAIATDTDGTLLIADQGAKTVWRLNPQVGGPAGGCRSWSP